MNGENEQGDTNKVRAGHAVTSTPTARILSQQGLGVLQNLV